MLRRGTPYTWSELISKVKALAQSQASTLSPQPQPEAASPVQGQTPTSPPQEPAREDIVPVTVKSKLTVDGIRINGSIYTAVRPVCEELGHTVIWDGTQVIID